MGRESRQWNSATRRKVRATVIALATSLGHGTAHSVECVACGRDALLSANASDPRRFELGHIQPESDGGRFHLTNLLPLCRRCNETMDDAHMLTVLTPRYTITEHWSGNLLPDPGPFKDDNHYEWLAPQ